jgi:lysophospholipase L1-like esterase
VRPRATDSPNLVRVALLLVALVSLFATSTVVLGLLFYRVSTRAVQLNDLGEGQRWQLLQQAQRVAPELYEPYRGVPQPGFYRLRPKTLYDRSHPAAGPAGVLGDVFTTNELGFRSSPVMPKAAGLRRVVVVGDSWTFGPGVRFADVFTQRLQQLLNRAGPSWEVINLGMMGWNTENELAALRVLLPMLRPDVVVICPTSNDIDDSYEVWNGRLVRAGFDSGAIFRNSYEYERRWVEAFRRLQEASDFLRVQGIASFIYFLADWHGLAPYYARLANLTTAYTVVPGPYIGPAYRLPAEVDPGQHATAEGHQLIGSSLYNALLRAGIVPAGEPVVLKHAAEFPSQRYDPAAIANEFAAWRDIPRTPDLMPLDGAFMRLEAMVSLPARPDTTAVVTEFEVTNLPGLYPLRLRIDVPSPEGAFREQVFERYVPGHHRVEIPKPRSLDRFDFVEVHVRVDRVVTTPGSGLPVSIRKPKIYLR